MKSEERADLAIDLANTLVKIACAGSLGPLGGLSAPIADLAAKKVKDKVQQRRMQRLLDECVDTVAEQVIRSLNEQGELRDLPDNELSAAVLAVHETLQLGSLNVSRIVQHDANVEEIEKSLRPASASVLAKALLSQDAVGLFERLLQDSCACITEVMSALPGFQVATATELLRRDTQIISDLRKAIARMPAPRDRDDFTVSYRRTVANKFDRMDLLGVNIKERASRRYPLTVAYISLQVMADSEEKLLRKSSLRQPAVGQRIEEILRNQKRMLLIGEAGSGKTTLLRWLAVQSARRKFDSPLEKWNELIPFLIPMRSYPDGRFPSLNQFPSSISSTIADDLPPQWVPDLLLKGAALVLIDGIDELPDERSRSAAQEWIEDLASEFPNSTFIVTSRPAVIKDFVPGFRVAELQPMSIADINIFIRRWHDALREELGDQQEAESIPADQRSILSTIEKDPHLRSLANNPLLCALLCALNRQREGDLPRRRSEIYRAALEMLLERRDKLRGLGTLDSDAQTIILQELAFWLLRQGMLDVSKARASDVIERILSSLPGMTASADEVLGHLLRRSGLVREPVVGQIDFVHRTFQDYLAGKAAVENDEIGLLISNANSDQWRDVIIMAAALCQPKQREELLGGLIAAGRQHGGQRLRLLPVACLQNAPQLSADLRRDIENIARKLLPPKSREAAQSLAAAGDVVIEVLSGHGHMTSEEAGFSIRLASMLGTDEALGLISAIAQTHSNIEEELVRAWRLFDPEKYAKKVLNNADMRSGLTLGDLELLPYTAYLGTLNSLQINVSDAVDLSALGGRPDALRTLSVRRRPRASLKGIEKWNGIEDLEIVFENTISDLRPVGFLLSLKKLRIQVVHGIAVKIRLGPVLTLSRLEEINVSCDTRHEIYFDDAISSSLRSVILEDSAEISEKDKEALSRSGIAIVRGQV